VKKVEAIETSEGKKSLTHTQSVLASFVLAIRRGFHAIFTGLEIFSDRPLCFANRRPKCHESNVISTHPPYMFFHRARPASLRHTGRALIG